jgi:hypothetical protein
MNRNSQPLSFLIVFEDDGDAVKIDKAIETKKLGYQKLGKRTYLAFLYEEPQDAHSKLKRELGIVGKLTWVRLPYADITE